MQALKNLLSLQVERLERDNESYEAQLEQAGLPEVDKGVKFEETDAEVFTSGM